MEMRIMMRDHVQDTLVQNLIPKPSQMQTIHQEIRQKVGLMQVTGSLDLTIDIRPKIDHGNMKLFSDLDTCMCILLCDIVRPIQWQVDSRKGCSPHISVDRRRCDQDDLSVGRVVGRVRKSDGRDECSEVLLVG
jgi:hypothetical protein